MNKCIVVFLLFVSMSMKDRFAAFSSGYDDDDEVEESCVLNSAIRDEFTNFNCGGRSIEFCLRLPSV